MREQDEIVARIEEVQQTDMLGFEWEEYLKALDWEHLEPLLIPERVDEIREEFEQEFRTDEDVRKFMADYMEFAWGKANNCRGISASRSVMHYQAWLWLIGYEPFEDDDPRWGPYEFYGKPQLEWVCKELGLDHSQWDDGIRSNTEYWGDDE